jgi:hypothetical protein
VAERWHWTVAEWGSIESLAMRHRMGRASARKGGPNRHQRDANMAARELRALASRATGEGERRMVALALARGRM